MGEYEIWSEFDAATIFHWVLEAKLPPSLPAPVLAEYQRVLHNNTETNHYRKLPT